MTLKVVHPFPARMAPDLARHAVYDLPVGSKLLDPMCGSGVVLRSAVEHGVDAAGVDIDPLAVLMARVWSSTLDLARFLHDAHSVVGQAKDIEDVDLRLGWQDDETLTFVKFWFGQRQRTALTALGSVLSDWSGSSRDALYLAISRIIITKDRGASLAKDVSHSRPHKSWEETDYDVYGGFLASCRAIASRHCPHLIRGSSIVSEGDSRRLDNIGDSSVDVVVTSPPYLNAIDYIRGHRLSLVWMGYDCAATKRIRSTSIGAERAGDDAIDIKKYVFGLTELPVRQQSWIRRYYSDASRLVCEIARVGRPGARVVIVVGDSFLRGCSIKNATIFEDLLVSNDFRDVRRVEREIPSRRRYLPPPGSANSPLDSRMRNEVVLMSSCPLKRK